MNKVQTTFGHVGSCASVACAIHCIAMPFLIAVLPALGIGWLAHGLFEIGAMLFAIGFSLMSLCWGYKTHKQLRVFAVLAAGAMWMVLAYNQHNHWYSVAGGICLIVANFMNRKLCKTCHSCKDHHGSDGKL